MDFQIEEACIDCTYACNLQCIHCNVRCLAGSGRKELGGDEMVGLFDQLAEAGVSRVVLTGGEVLLRPDWERLVGEACGRFAVIVFTNAVCVTREMADALARMAKPPAVEVSVYGATAPVYDTVTGVPGSFERFRAGLAALREAGLCVMPKSMLLRENIHEWRLIHEEFGRCEGFKWDFRLSPRFDGKQDPVAHRATDVQVLDFLRGLGVSRKKRKKAHRLRSARICGMACTGCAVSAFGDIFPCGMMPLSGGNIREKSFREIWQGSKFAEIRALRMGDLAECMACGALPYCKPCPGRNVLERGDMRLPCPDSCRRARFRQLVAEA